jgi:dTDP-4-amino-4,6-dideoxygalactose transaminase
MKVPLLDLKAHYAAIRHEIEPAVKEVFESQYFIQGPKVREFENTVAKYTGASHAIGCASGSDALLLALMAIGLKEGDEVITTPHTFFATASAITRLGGKPVFCDIKPDTMNIDPEKITSLITSRTKAILPVHIFGLMAGMGPILDIAKKHGLKIIEDAAQAIGSDSPWGKAGVVGDIGCFSFFPSKNLGGAGVGGMVVTDDDQLAENVTLLREHGSRPKYYHSVVGINSRLDALQGAVLSVKLSHLDNWTAGRQANARFYLSLIEKKGLTSHITVPVIPEGYRHIFNQFVIRAKKRDELRAFLTEKEIGTEIYYPVPLHLQECFAYLGYSRGDFPVSEETADTALAIPIYPELTNEMKEYVIGCIEEFIKKQ